MIRIFRYDFSSPGRVRIAAIFGAGALALLALDAGLKLQPSPFPAPAPAVARIAAPSETGGVHNLTYYPEQLAALNSLASFTPQANAGVADDGAAPAAASPAAAALPAAIEVRPVRRADQAAKPAAHAAAAPTPEADRAVRLFGVAVPGAAAVADGFARFKDSAAHWGESAWAASGRAASIWR
jgi:hypothetical protein